MTNEAQSSHASLIGGGIASLAAAVFLVRDAGMPGENIHILEELPQTGGALDGSGAPYTGFVFTVEYSVRGAMHAVYELLGVAKEVPAVYHALSDPLTALRALKAVFA
ncbi:oleate hydratase [Streptomyces sp. NPDC090021]|uniref:oleate hydratase n=1 Tax=Streptomyces sp. NPDC090021 TaxID=3365919 RepID=UPI003826AAB7